MASSAKTSEEGSFVDDLGEECGQNSTPPQVPIPNLTPLPCQDTTLEEATLNTVMRMSCDGRTSYKNMKPSVHSVIMINSEFYH